MRRRDVMIAFGGAAVALAAHAQQNDRMRRVGLLLGATEENDPEAQNRVAAFRQGLEALGWTEGRNIRIDYRFAGGDADRIQSNVVELVASTPDLIVANSSPVIAALKRATSTIPIVFAVVNDPVGQGFVAGLAHPGGNITGFTLMQPEIIGKWLELLTEMAPNITRAKLLFNPVTGPFFAVWLREYGAISKKPATELAAAPVHDESEVEEAIADLGSTPGGGLIGAADIFTVSHRASIMRLAERYRVPAIYQFRQFASEGGLISYGPDTADIFRRSAAYVDRILKGADPADLPVQQPIKFELVINLKTAEALGLAVSPTLLARADEVIE